MGQLCRSYFSRTLTGDRHDPATGELTLHDDPYNVEILIEFLRFYHLHDMC